MSVEGKLITQDRPTLSSVMEDGFGLFGTYLGEPSACYHYRIMTPFRSLYNLGKANVFIDRGRLDDESTKACMLNADIVQIFSSGGRLLNGMISVIKNMRPGRSSDGEKVIFPPSVVYDIDDNMDWVHPFNEAFVRLGTRAYDGTLLKPGDSLTGMFEDGQERVIWEDKVTRSGNTLFDIQENINRVKGMHDTARMADGVTVPSEHLAKYYRETHKCQNVFVYPNSVDPSDYPKAHLMPHEGVRILWQGGGSHMPDWYPLRDAVRTIALKYPQVKFVIWGSAFRWIHDNIPSEQVEFVDWMDYPAYKPMRVLIDADINLCPLVDNEFNRSKSAIKWYESIMPFTPEATLAAKVPPYSEEMTDGENSLLYETPQDFVEKLSALIESVELRKRLGGAAREWVLANRAADKTAPKLFEFYQSLRVRKQIALGA